MKKLLNMKQLVNILDLSEMEIPSISSKEVLGYKDEPFEENTEVRVPYTQLIKAHVGNAWANEYDGPSDFIKENICVIAKGKEGERRYILLSVTRYHKYCTDIMRTFNDCDAEVHHSELKKAIRLWV